MDIRSGPSFNYKSLKDGDSHSAVSGDLEKSLSKQLPIQGQRSNELESNKLPTKSQSSSKLNLGEELHQNQSKTADPMVEAHGRSQVNVQSIKIPDPTHRLRSGKGVYILTGLRGEVNTNKEKQAEFIETLNVSTISNSENVGKLKDILEAKSKLIRELNKEIATLMINPEYATDEFVSIEIQEVEKFQNSVVEQQLVLNPLITSLQPSVPIEDSPRVSLLQTGNDDMVTESIDLLKTLKPLYPSNSSKTAHFRFDGELVNFEKLEEFLSKDSHKDITFHVRHGGTEEEKMEIKQLFQNYDKQCIFDIET